MSTITFNAEGSWTWNAGGYAGDNGGNFSFDMVYNPSTSKVNASGSDIAGPFTIYGFFDGVQLRFEKRYPSWEWTYSGAVVTTNPSRNSYSIAGSWGRNGAQTGTFTLTLAPAAKSSDFVVDS